jgi:two-component system chemotaxis response regulator CheB
VRQDQPTGASAAVTRDVIVIGASTGGPAALAELLGALPSDLPAAVLVVQHMSQGFMEGLARWLDATCPLPVGIAVNGQRLLPGTVTLAPDGANTELDEGLRLRLTPAGPRQFHVPSVDLAFASAARVCGESAVGILLTGMGRDGAAGLGQLREAGGLTLAQDEASSVVWGMPGAAVAAGAAALVLPLDELAAAAVSRERPVPA